MLNLGAATQKCALLRSESNNNLVQTLRAPKSPHIAGLAMIRLKQQGPSESYEQI